MAASQGNDDIQLDDIEAMMQELGDEQQVRTHASSDDDVVTDSIMHASLQTGSREPRLSPPSA